MIIFDIETGPLPEEQLRKIAPPFKALPPPGEFDPWAVKTGSMKDEKKIQAKVAKAKEEHRLAMAQYEQRIAVAEIEYWQGVTEKAALDATTGQVLAIGIGHLVDKVLQPTIYDQDNDDESTILEDFWELIREAEDGNRFAGFNIFGFDLPFLVRRSWALDVEIPHNLIDHGRRWSPIFIDLMQVWQCGNYRQYIKLDTLAASLGAERKIGDGADFHKLWKSDHQAAIDYLTQDLRVTMQVAQRMGVC